MLIDDVMLIKCNNTNEKVGIFEYPEISLTLFLLSSFLFQNKIFKK